MKALTNYQRTVQYLNRVFKEVNEYFFDNELEVPTITIQSTVGAYGHITTSKVWKTETGKESYELNIGAEYLTRDCTDLISTLIHECCHLKALQDGIKDTSNRGVYHNKRFKALGEEHGIAVSKHPKYGWTLTEPTERVIDFCISRGIEDIKISRGGGYSFTGTGTPKAGNGTGAKGTEKKKSSSIKWICPCGTIVRSTKEVNIICGDCGEHFEKAE